MAIRFFLPEELHNLWNTAASWEERFLASLLADYLTTEKVFHNAALLHGFY
ncbi:MAG: hypothetical protein RDV48_30700 [Candidatus Eremiobacteraeota bacterium]|nr:hypothetical protein [Candidatus Eremiobacteraeota bacterium]